MAETNGLLNRRTGFTRTEGSNPSRSAISLAHRLVGMFPYRFLGGQVCYEKQAMEDDIFSCAAFVKSPNIFGLPKSPAALYLKLCCA